MDLARTLGVRAGARLAIVDPPVRFGEDLQLPADVESLTLEDRDLDCVILFIKDRTTLPSTVASAARVLAPTGTLWVAWPKQLSGYNTDMNGEAVQASGLRSGLLDTRRLSPNDGWTAMRFIVRVDDRDGWSKRSFD